MLLDIMSSNTGSLTVNGRLWGIQRFLREHKLDVLTVQETHLTDEDVLTFKRILPDFSILANNGNQAERGVALFCAPETTLEEVPLANLYGQVPELLNIDSGRLIVARVTKDNFKTTVINVYAPNN